jgi:hypothetical protein
MVQWTSYARIGVIFSRKHRDPNEVIMMKSSLFIILAWMMLTHGTFGQAVRSMPAPDKDPFVGKWQANRDKSQPKLDARGASYVRTVTREGNDLVFSSRIDNPNGIENHYNIRCDGQFHPVPFGSLSCEYKAPNLVEGETKSLDGKRGYWTREVSSDGREMTESEYKDKGRRKLQSVEVMDRVN